MNATEILLLWPLLLLGLCTGFAAGLLGIGGGMLMVPFLTWYLGSMPSMDGALAVKMAIATSMATIVPTSLASMRKHQQKGLVVWPVVWGLAGGVLVGALCASVGVFSRLPSGWLAWCFAGFVGWSAIQMLRSVQRTEAPMPTLPANWELVGVGSAIGFLSGLVGAGGGFLTVPYLNHRGLGIHRAVACSAALGFPIALFNTLGYGLFAPVQVQGAWGYVYIPAWVMLAVGSVLAAPWGAKAAHALPVPRLKQIFASVLLVLASYMAWRGYALLGS